MVQCTLVLPSHYVLCERRCFFFFCWEKHLIFAFPEKRNPPLWTYTQLTILICLRLLCQHWYAHVRTGGHYFWPIDLSCGSLSQSSCLSCQKHYVQLIEVENENGDEMSRTSWPCYVILGVSLQTDDGEDDLKKGTQLLEIYALEIQMYTAQKNNKKLKALYEQSLHIKSAIPHPLIMGVIRGELVHVFPLGMLRLRGLAWRFSYFSPRVWRENAFERGWVWESSHGLLWGLQKLRRVWKPEKNDVPEVLGPSQHVDEVGDKSFWLSRGMK